MSDLTERNIEVVKKGIEAFSTGDIDTMMSLFDDNIEWVQPGDSAISGTYHGKGELGDACAPDLPRRRRHGDRAQRNDCWQRNKRSRAGVDPPGRQDSTGPGVPRYGDGGARLRQEARPDNLGDPRLEQVFPVHHHQANTRGSARLLFG